MWCEALCCIHNTFSQALHSAWPHPSPSSHSLQAIKHSLLLLRRFNTNPIGRASGYTATGVYKGALQMTTLYLHGVSHRRWSHAALGSFRLLNSKGCHKCQHSKTHTRLLLLSNGLVWKMHSFVLSGYIKVLRKC